MTKEEIERSQKLGADLKAKRKKLKELQELLKIEEQKTLEMSRSSSRPRNQTAYESVLDPTAGNPAVAAVYGAETLGSPIENEFRRSSKEKENSNRLNFEESKMPKLENSGGGGPCRDRSC